MRDFFEQPHHPIVTVSTKNGVYTLEQHSSRKSDNATKWNVPLVAENTQTGKLKTIWLLADGSTCGAAADEFRSDEPSGGVWLFNSRGFAVARVRYETSIWTQMLKADWSKVDELSLLALAIDRLWEEGAQE